MSLVSVEANFRLRSRENDIQEYNTINATLEQVPRSTTRSVGFCPLTDRSNWATALQLVEYANNSRLLRSLYSCHFMRLVLTRIAINHELSYNSNFNL